MNEKTFLNNLLSNLDSTCSSPLSNSHPPTPSLIQSFLTQPTIKPTLLTLHCIFPDHLLPALDLLERGNVTQLILKPDATGSEDQQASIYYVETSSQRSSRFTQVQATRTFYEVRLKAWNCTCPAFTFAALDGELEGGFEMLSVTDAEVLNVVGDGMSGRMGYGGLATGDKSAPMCKHLMACLLANASSFLSTCVKSKSCTREDLAAWAAGWVQ